MQTINKIPFITDFIIQRYRRNPYCRIYLFEDYTNFSKIIEVRASQHILESNDEIVCGTVNDGQPCSLHAVNIDTNFSW